MDYDLDLFTVVVADDNAYMRSLLKTVMHTMGVGTVIAVNDGSEAIETLKKVGEDPSRGGINAVDLVMANWQMSPVDGLLLLKWVRRHKDSPDKFMPFVMVTGFADMGHVNEARDLGVTEILSKPYSIQSLTQRMGQVVERPRQFVLTSTYFGPDRRRRKTESRLADRRKIKPEEVEIIYDDEIA